MQYVRNYTDLRKKLHHTHKNLEAMFATGLWAEIESGAAKMMQSAAERWPDELSEAAPAFDMTRTVDTVHRLTTARYQRAPALFLTDSCFYARLAAGVCREMSEVIS